MIRCKGTVAWAPSMLLWLGIILGLFTPSLNAQDLRLEVPAREVSPRVSWGILDQARRAHPDEWILAIAEEVEGHTLDEVEIERLGGEVRDRIPGLARVAVRARDVERLARSLGGLKRLRRPLMPVAVGQDSEGVDLTAASDYHGVGVDGQGIAVAVLDLGFAGLSELIAAGELPDSLHRANFADGDLEGTTYHGSAVAEQVYEMAPGCELHVVKVDDEISLARATAYCLERGIRIINHSVGWFNTNFFDGQGVVCEIARTAAQGGILWVNAAGNSAQRHWEGPFADEDGDGLCEFRPGDEGIEIAAFRGVRIQVALNWDSWVERDTDLDLLLVDESNTIVADSRNDQRDGHDPVELIDYEVESSGRYRVVVAHQHGRRDLAVEVYSFTLDIEGALQVRESCLVNPADAQEVLAVGAVHWLNYDTGPVQSYSSRGPNNAGLPKPDLVGPDAIGSSIYGIFAGTSASAPHVAGAAALLWSRDPSRSSESIREGLLSLATWMGESNAYGHGTLLLRDVTPPWPEARFEVEPRSETSGTITMRAGKAEDPSSVQYAFERRGDDVLARDFSTDRDHHIDELRPNTAYEFRVRQRDFSPLLNENDASDWSKIRTSIETPRGVTIRSVSTDTLFAEIEGTFTGLEVGNSALRLDAPTLGPPANSWVRARGFWLTGLRPNTTYGFHARARNGEGEPTAKVGPYYGTTLAAVPPVPRIDRVDGPRIQLSLAVGDNPPHTELALYDAVRAQFARPSGEWSKQPFFAPVERWNHHWFDRSEWEGWRHLHARARNEAGEPSDLSPALSVLGIGAEDQGTDSEGVVAESDSPGLPGGDGFSSAPRSRGPSTPLSDSRLVIRAEPSSGRTVRLSVEGIDGARASFFEFIREGATTSIIATTEAPRHTDRDVSPNSVYRYKVRLRDGGARVRESGWIRVVTDATVPKPLRVDAVGTDSLRARVRADKSFQELRFRLASSSGQSRTTPWASNVERVFSDLDRNHIYSVQVQGRNRAGRTTGWSSHVGGSLLPLPPELEPQWHRGAEIVWLDLSRHLSFGDRLALWDIERRCYLDAGLSPHRGPVWLERSQLGRLPWMSNLKMNVMAKRRDRKGGLSDWSKPVLLVDELAPRLDDAPKKDPGESAEKNALDLTRVSSHSASIRVDGRSSQPRWIVWSQDGEERSKRLSDQDDSMVLSELQANTPYELRIVAGADPRMTGDLTPPVTLHTQMSPPSNVQIDARSHSATIDLRGGLEHLGRGQSAVRLVDENGKPRTKWSSRRRLEVRDLNPGTPYTLTLQRRNRVGEIASISTMVSWQSDEVRTPKIELRGRDATGLALGLIGDGPIEACLFEAHQGVYYAPSGRTSPWPVYAPLAEWQHVTIRNLVPENPYEFRTRHRDLSGALGSFGPSLKVVTPKKR